MTRVLITEDSPTTAEIIKIILSKDCDIEVVGWAKNGKECIKLTEKLKPDVITMDIRMPVMDGFEATKYIMSNFPTPILVVSSSINDDLNISFNALKFGALDVLEKPRMLTSSEMIASEIKEDFIQRLKAVSRVKPFKKFYKSFTLAGDDKKQKVKISPSATKEEGILSIGASTGGPATLNYILKRLPSEFPFSIIITQHITQGFTSGLIKWLKNECYLNIKLGENNEDIQNGTIYIAPDNCHMGVTSGKKILLSNSPPVSGHRPSVDFLMESVASAYKENSMGVILTGMGKDGAKGMLSIRKAGGFTISQDESSSIIFGMPKAAIEIEAVMKTCPIEQIPEEIIQWAKGKQKIYEIAATT